MAPAEETSVPSTVAYASGNSGEKGLFFTGGSILFQPVGNRPYRVLSLLLLLAVLVAYVGFRIGSKKVNDGSKGAGQ